MKKKIKHIIEQPVMAIAIVILLGLSIYGLSQSPTPIKDDPGIITDNNTVIEIVTRPTLIIYYDPRTEGLIQLNTDILEIKALLPEINIVQKCVDHALITTNEASDATNTCTSKDGTTLFAANSKQAQIRLIDDEFFAETGLGLYTSYEGQANRLDFTPFNNILAGRICDSFTIILDGCTTLEPAPPVKVQLFSDSNCDSCAMKPAFLEQLEAYGMNSNYIRDLEFPEMREAVLSTQKYYQRYIPFALIDINGAEQYGPKMENLFSANRITTLYNNNIIPGDIKTSRYVGNRQTDLKIEMFLSPFCTYSQQLVENVKTVTDLLPDENFTIKPKYITYISNQDVQHNCESRIIGTETYTQCALFGINELEESRRQACIINKDGIDTWLEYASCYKEKQDYQKCLDNTDLEDQSYIENCSDSDFAFGKINDDQFYVIEKSAYQTPLLVLSGESHPIQGPYDEQTLLKVFCDRYSLPKPEVCDTIFEEVNLINGFCSAN